MISTNADVLKDAIANIKKRRLIQRCNVL